MHRKGAGYDGVHWFHLTQNMNQWNDLVYTVTNFQVPLKSGRFLDQLRNFKCPKKKSTPWNLIPQ
jgi:hypothetical protein